ncbi:hypothetical protein KRZ98_18025, partial [Sphingobium sp. AS12]|uniref:hypothetical protein n=1 Tax=Sphingobium sp. AS12 TaxID=2849495 RepID=UPI001C314E09
MNTVLMLEHYARIADAPDAINRLRQFVLDLAVRGKLVEQDADDEPVTKACGQLGDSLFRADRIQDWRRERHLGSTRIKRRAVGAGPSV